MTSSVTGRLIRFVLLTWSIGLCQALETTHALKDLALLDASFASQVVDRQPSRVAQSYRLASLTGSQLWFWVHVSCTGACEQQLAGNGQVKIFLDWYLEEDGILKKQASLPLNVKGTTWRTWGVKRVAPGTWVVVVRAEDSQWVCLKEQCDFAITVKGEDQRAGRGR